MQRKLIKNVVPEQLKDGIVIKDSDQKILMIIHGGLVRVARRRDFTKATIIKLACKALEDRLLSECEDEPGGFDNYYINEIRSTILAEPDEEPDYGVEDHEDHDFGLDQNDINAGTY